jgi:hypothetical protein
MIIVHSLPSDYRWATPYEADNADQQPDAIQVHSEPDPFYGPLLRVAVPAALPLPCVREFGTHDCQPDCERILYDMHPEPFYNEAPYSPYTFYETSV